MRANRWSPLRLLGTLRGEGKLIGPGVPTAVRYQIDLFKRGEQRTAAGELEGRLASFVDQPETARLRLADGAEIGIVLTDVRAGLVMFDADEAGTALCHLAGTRRTPVSWSEEMAPPRG